METQKTGYQAIQNVLRRKGTGWNKTISQSKNKIAELCATLAHCRKTKEQFISMRYLMRMSFRYVQLIALV
jgi:hypothetical protein